MKTLEQRMMDFLIKYVHDITTLKIMSEEFSRILNVKYEREEIEQALDDFDLTRGSKERLEISSLVRRIEDSRERAKLKQNIFLDELDDGFTVFFSKELQKFGFEGPWKFLYSELDLNQKNVIYENIKRDFEDISIKRI